MRTTIDKAERLVIPKALRDQVGIVAGEVEVTIDGAGLHIAPAEFATLVEEDGFLVIPRTGTPITDDMIQELRNVDRGWA